MITGVLSVMDNGQDVPKATLLNALSDSRAIGPRAIVLATSRCFSNVVGGETLGNYLDRAWLPYMESP